MLCSGSRGVIKTERDVPPYFERCAVGVGEHRRAQAALRCTAPKLGDRTFIDTVLYRAKTGVPWRDLPERFGSWKTVFNRFSNWSRRGHWATIFKALQIEVDEAGS
jgi:transposase